VISVIEIYSPEGEYRIAPYFGIPLCCLIEDATTGLRWLVINGSVVLPAHRDSAVRAGAHGVVRPGDGLFASMSDFERTCSKDGAWDTFLEAPAHIWVSLDRLPIGEDLLTSRALPALGKATEFVHLHVHSDFSPLDGLALVDEIVDRVVLDGQRAVALTDHGVCAGHPKLQQAADKAGIKPIFGIEANFVMTMADKTKETMGAYWHLILLATNEVGLRNLWAASTAAYKDGYYGRARLDWSVLERFNEGLICSTACLRGPLADLILKEDEYGAIAQLARLQAIFGDRLLIELHTNQLPQQRLLNERLVSLAHDRSLPLIVVADSHYACQEDQGAHQAWIALQTNKDLQDEGDLFAGHQDYHVSTAAEVAASISYLGPEVVEAAMRHTVTVADSCDVTIKKRSSTPVFNRRCDEPYEKDNEHLRALCEAAFTQRVAHKANAQVYRDRLEEELDLLTTKRFSGYMLMVWDQCHFAKTHGILMGPGRGSAAGSVVCWLLHITEVDPVRYRLQFGRFLTPGRTSLPDVDSDFPTSKRGEITAYTVDRWGEAHVVRVGTHTRLKSKGVIRDLSRVLASTIDIHFPDIEECSKIIGIAEGGTAGMGLEWDDLWFQYGDYQRDPSRGTLTLNQMRAKYPVLFSLADKLVGRLRTYGRHPAGLVIDPMESILDRLPLRRSGKDGEITTEFDMEALEFLGYVKLDDLTLRTLDTIQSCIDLIAADPLHSSSVPDLYGWDDDVEYLDPDVWEMLCSGDTLGCFQIETPEGTRLVKRYQPHSIEDLGAVITLVRPGPTRSGLTESYLRRRKGDEPVSFAHPLLEECLGPTYGTMIYQEDIMDVCRVLAGYDDDEADSVRKILGKKKVSATDEAGRKFVEAAVARGIERKVVDQLWEQMAEFAKYSFNRCVTGDSRVHLAGTGPASTGLVAVADLHRRLHADTVRLPGQMSCAGCERELRPRATVGICPACRVWRYKFDHKGLFGLAHHSDGRIKPSRIVDVYDSGVQEVWTITVADGRSITATANHRHMSSYGFEEVQNLRVGDLLMVDGGYEQRGYVAALDRTTVGAPQMAGAVKGAFGESNYAFVDGGFASLSAWTAQAPQCCEECGHDGSEHRLERAHLDGNHQNNEWDNLRLLCVSCHKRYDYEHNGRRRRWQKGHVSRLVEIVSIVCAGHQQTYDVEMESPHNLVVNGIVTHNSHAIGYAVLAFWTAWLKKHYPAHFTAALLSTVDKDRIPEFVEMARRSGYKVLPPDINQSGAGFAVGSDRLSVRYGFDSVKGIGGAALQALMVGQPYTSWEDFMLRKGKAANLGFLKTLAKLGVFNSILGESRNQAMLEAHLEEVESGAVERCVHLGGVLRSIDACQFDWSTEPVPLSPKTQRPMKSKPPPKACTKACRQYVPIDPTDWPVIGDLSDQVIRWRERDHLGVFLSSTPFDRIPPDLMENFRLGSEIEGGPNGRYYTAVLVNRVKTHRGRDGREMAFVSMYAFDQALDVTVFNSLYERLRRDIKQDAFALVVIEKNDRGFTLIEFDLIPEQKETVDATT
jgi:DNA polymerase III subunit alpha